MTALWPNKLLEMSIDEETATMTIELTELEVHRLIDEARRPDNSPSINDVILRLDGIADRVAGSYTTNDDPVHAYRAIWSCGLSEILTRDGNAETYRRCLRNRDKYGYLHIQDKSTYYCVLAELFREEGQFVKALEVLRGIQAELETVNRDEFVEKDLHDVAQLIALNQKQ